MSKLTLETAGELIGSRRWGGWYDKSDYDIIIKESDYLEIIAYLNVVPARDHNYSAKGELLNAFHSYYVDKNSGKTYNFLVYKSDTFFEIAKEASRQLDIICRTSLGIIMRNDKNVRYSVVGNTFKAVKMLFDSNVNRRLFSLYGEDSAFGIVPAPTDYPIRMEERARQNRRPYSMDIGIAGTDITSQTIRAHSVVTDHGLDSLIRAHIDTTAEGTVYARATGAVPPNL